jgi:transposase
MAPCIHGSKLRDKPVKYDKRRYRMRNRIEIMFGRLKDWRRIATHYERSREVFLSHRYRCELDLLVKRPEPRGRAFS